MTFHQTLANRPIKSRISGLPRPVSVNYLHMLSKQYNHTSVVFPLLMFYVACRALVAPGLKGFCGYCSTLLFLVTALTNVFFQLSRPTINATLDHFNHTLHYAITLAGALCVCVRAKFSCTASFPRFITHRERYEVAFASRCLSVSLTVVMATTQNNARSV